MKLSQSFSMFSVLAMAASVTAGSMYVTLGAAAQQEAAEVAIPVGDEELAGALGAIGAGDPPLPPGEIISNRSVDVVLDSAGSFSGRLTIGVSGPDAAPAAGFAVKLLQEGGPVLVTETDATGNFSFSGAKTGVAGLLATSDNAMVLSGLRLIATDEQHPVREGVDLEVAVTAAADYTFVRDLIIAKMPAADLRFSGPVNANDETFPFGTGAPVTSIDDQPVQLMDDGTVHGTISLMDERTGRLREILDVTVYFVQEGKLVSSAVVAANGSFVASGLHAGHYSVVGVGQDGTLALGVELVGGGALPLASGSAGSEYTPVSIRAAGEFAGSLVPAGLFNSGNAPELTEVEEELEVLIPPATVGVGGTSGGGGGGGGLGLLGLAGLAGLAGLNGDDCCPATPGY